MPLKLNQLPNDVLFEISTYLTLKEIIALSKTNKSLHHVLTTKSTLPVKCETISGTQVIPYKEYIKEVDNHFHHIKIQKEIDEIKIENVGCDDVLGVSLTCAFHHTLFSLPLGITLFCALHNSMGLVAIPAAAGFGFLEGCGFRLFDCAKNALKKRELNALDEEKANLPPSQLKMER